VFAARNRSRKGTLPKMPKSTAAIARRAALATLALLLAACAAVPVPSGPGPPVIAPREARSLGVAPVQGTRVTFAMTTVTGIPGKFQIALQQSLQKFAATRDVLLVSTSDPKATYRVEGYISAIGDVNRVVLVYVWDVFDTTGNRVHRFSGEEPTQVGAVDPWTAVKLDMIDDAARETIDALADWARV
jgi:hypothetical protein